MMPKAGVFLFFAVAIVIVVLFALQPPAVRLVVTATPSASATPSAAASAARASSSVAPPACASLVRGTFFADGSIDERARAAQAYLESHPGEQAWVIITEGVLNAAAVREAQSQPVRDLRITIEPAGFRMSMTAVMIGSFPIKVLIVPRASNGTVAIELRELDTDGLPGFFRGTVEDSIRRAADPSSWGLRMRVDGIATDVGCAVVWGRA